MATTTVVQRSGVVTVGCACTGGTSSLRCRWPWQQPFITAVIVGPVTYNALRSQETARAEATNTAPRSQRRRVVAGDTEFFSLYEDELGGTRGLTGCTRPGRRRGTSGTPWNRLSTPCSSFRRLMFLCRRWKTSWWTYAGFSMSSFPEQAIEVPKISPTPRPPRRRRVRFTDQTAEQLVEVPTIISYSSLQRTAEQNVNIPVPGRGGQHVGLQGFLPRQRSTALQASQERSSERIVEQIVDSRVLGGGSSASSSSSREHAGEGFFRTIPRVKKSPKLGSRSGSETAPRVEPIHAERSSNGS